MIKFQAILKRRWPILLIAFVVGAVAGTLSTLVSSEQVVVQYQASQVIAAQPDASTSGTVSQDALKVTRGRVPVEAAKLLGMPEQSDVLASSIEVAVDDPSRTITVSTTDTDKDAATKRVDAFVQAFLSVTNSNLTADARKTLALLQQDIDDAQADRDAFDQAHPEIATIDPEVTGDLATTQLFQERRRLTDRIVQAQVEYRRKEVALGEVAPYDTMGVEPAKVADAGLLEIPRSKVIRGALFSMVGLSLGAALVLLLERSQRKIDTRDELAELVDLPVLAEIGLIPEKRRPRGENGEVLLEGVWAEPYRRIRSAIQYVMAARHAALTEIDPTVAERSEAPLSILVTSTSPAEGKSTTAALTGYALAEVGIPTLVVGADFRKPEVDSMLGVPQVPSIRDLASRKSGSITVPDVVHDGPAPDLYVAPAGVSTREVTGLIGATQRVVREALTRGVNVLIDSSPLQVANDTLDLLPVADYVILVVRSGSSSADDLLDTIETLTRLNAEILGLVLVGTPSVGKKQASYYDYYTVADIRPDDRTADQLAKVSEIARATADRPRVAADGVRVESPGADAFDHHSFDSDLTATLAPQTRSAAPSSAEPADSAVASDGTVASDTEESADSASLG